MLLHPLYRGMRINPLSQPFVMHSRNNSANPSPRFEKFEIFLSGSVSNDSLSDKRRRKRQLRQVLFGVLDNDARSQVCDNPLDPVD